MSLTAPWTRVGLGVDVRGRAENPRQSLTRCVRTTPMLEERWETPPRTLHRSTRPDPRRRTPELYGDSPGAQGQGEGTRPEPRDEQHSNQLGPTPGRSGSSGPPSKPQTGSSRLVGLRGKREGTRGPQSRRGLSTGDTASDLPRDTDVVGGWPTSPEPRDGAKSGVPSGWSRTLRGYYQN